jgi:C-terminal processing protease CtpA/Prc
MAVQVGYNTAMSMSLSNHETQAFNTNMATDRDAVYEKIDLQASGFGATVVNQAPYEKFPTNAELSTALKSLVSDTATSEGHFHSPRVTKSVISVNQNSLNDVTQLPASTDLSSVTREVSVHQQEDGTVPVTLNEHILYDCVNSSSANQRKVILLEPVDSNAMPPVTGLLPGDQLIKIDGYSVESMNSSEALELIINNIRQNGTTNLTVSPLTELREFSLRSDRSGNSIAVFKHCASTGSLKRTASLRHLSQSTEVC